MKDLALGPFRRVDTTNEGVDENDLAPETEGKSSLVFIQFVVPLYYIAFHIFSSELRNTRTCYVINISISIIIHVYIKGIYIILHYRALKIFSKLIAGRQMIDVVSVAWAFAVSIISYQPKNRPQIIIN